jgi:hypothetical protein
MAQASEFLPGVDVTANTLIYAYSGAFNIVNGQPSSIILVQEPGEAADAEVFKQATAVLDEQGNVLSSDCYGDCAGQLTTQCTATSHTKRAECTVRLRASIQGTGASAQLRGSPIALAVNGMATFTDLAIDSGIDKESDCMCPSYKGCLMCHCDANRNCTPNVCNPPAPFPNFRIQINLVGFVSLPLEVPVRLRRRVSKMLISQQPMSSVAKEVFSNDIKVTVLDCIGEVVTAATASINIAIKDNAGYFEPGILSGTFPVAVVFGVATFTDLSIHSGGQGYSLVISFQGNVVVSDIQTAAFRFGRNAFRYNYKGREPVDSATTTRCERHKPERGHFVEGNHHRCNR